MGIDNPFAVQPRPSATWRAVRVLLLVAVCLSVVLALQYGSRRWLLHRLTADLAQQTPAVQIERLPAIAELGPIGLPVVARQLAAADPRVAAAAYDVLRSRQTVWMQLSDADGDAMHRLLAAAVSDVAGQLPENRRGWAAALLNQTIVETVEHTSSDADAAYRTATAALAQLSLSDAGQSIADAAASSNPHDSSVRIAQQTGPLPIGGSGYRAAASDSRYGRRGGVDGDGPAAEGAGATQRRPDEGEAADDKASDDSALQSVTPGATAPLQPVPSQHDRSAEKLPIQRVVVPAHHLTAAPFETYSTRSVIAWLQSVQPKLRQAAEQELHRRGLTAAEIQLATRLANADIRVRLALLDELGQRPDVQPRQWLLWLAEDAERDVRLRAIAALATMADPQVQKQLAERLPEERDTAVAAQIRRVLNRR